MEVQKKRQDKGVVGDDDDDDEDDSNGDENQNQTTVYVLFGWKEVLQKMMPTNINSNSPKTRKEKPNKAALNSV